MSNASYQVNKCAEPKKQRVTAMFYGLAVGSVDWIDEQVDGRMVEDFVDRMVANSAEKHRLHIEHVAPDFAPMREQLRKQFGVTVESFHDKGEGLPQ